MKRLGRVLLSILLIVPMLVGMAFLSPNLALEATQTAQNGGGGANSLNSGISGENDTDESDNAEREEVYITPTYKTYEDYFTDLNITKETITSKDYTGSGSIDNPFVVHSTKGWLYLTNYDISGISLVYRYVELASDIVLNEETFDKDGKVCGGDGVVYNWTDDYYSYMMRFDGKGHSIKGFCGIEFDTTITADFTRNLFSYESVNYLKNLNMKNVYIDGGNCSAVTAFSYSCNSVSNCSVDGFVKSRNEYNTASMFVSVVEAENCVNYADIYSTGGQVAGVFVKLSGTSSNIRRIINCDNYGNIYKYNDSYNGRVAGVSFLWYYVYAEGCDNYGKIYSEAGQVGGVVSWVSGTHLKNCSNYGEIDVNSKAQSGGVVGFVHWAYPTLVLDGCQNFGKLNGRYWEFGELIGYIRCLDENVTPVINVTLKNCYVKSVSGLRLIATSRVKVLNIENCKIDYVGNINNVTTVAFYYNPHRNSSINISNCEMNVYDKTISYIRICSDIYTESDVKIKNILINGSESVDFLPYGTVGEEYFDFLNGIVVCRGERSIYYGNDFSGFFVDFKTGKISLKRLGAKGFYQGKVTEEVLQNKGFSKRSL